MEKSFRKSVCATGNLEANTANLKKLIWKNVHSQRVMTQVDIIVPMVELAHQIRKLSLIRIFFGGGTTSCLVF